jgi:hypothetical protein
MRKENPENSGKKEGRDDKGRFVSGISGNPKGKPKGTISIVARLRRELLKIPPGLPKEERKTYVELVVKKYFQSIFSGSERILIDLVDRIDGKPKQLLDFGDSIPTQVIINLQNKEIEMAKERIKNKNGQK